MGNNQAVHANSEHDVTRRDESLDNAIESNSFKDNRPGAEKLRTDVSQLRKNASQLQINLQPKFDFSYPQQSIQSNRSTPSIIQRVWNSRDKWNEQGASALEQILTMLAPDPLYFLCQSTRDTEVECSFSDDANGANWISNEFKFTEGTIFHFAVGVVSFSVAIVDGDRANINIVLKNFHQTVRGKEDAEQFKAGGSLEPEKMEQLGPAQKKLLKFSKQYEKVFIHPKAEKGKHPAWKDLSVRERIEYVKDKRMQTKKLGKLSEDEELLLITYGEIQSRSLHASVRSSELQSGNTSNTAAASAALGVDQSQTGINREVSYENFKSELSRRIRNAGQITLPDHPKEGTITLDISTVNISE